MANLFFGVIFIIVGILVIIYFPKLLRYKSKDYSMFPVTKGTVLHMFDEDRWHVAFKNENGEEVIGKDDVILGSTFSPEKYNMPKTGQEVDIYYWKYDGNFKHVINGKTVEYYIHFVDESMYKLKQVKGKRQAIISVVVGIVIIIAGILMFMK